MAKLFRCCILLLFAAAGCHTAQPAYDGEFAQLTSAIHHAHVDANAIAAAVGPIQPHLEGPHSVDDYIRFALTQNPAVHAARKQMESLAFQVPVAASLQDPTLGVTVFPEPIQTASGKQEFGVTASQKIPWPGKLDSRAMQAESRTNVARAKLASVELDVIAKVKRFYYELYFVQQAVAVTEADKQLLLGIRDVAKTRYSANLTSQQDLLRAELELSNVENELIQLRQRLASAQGRLAKVLHVAPQTKLQASTEMPRNQSPLNLELLQQHAVAARPELHAKLAAIERDRYAVDLAKLDFRPDVTLGASWLDVSNSGISPVANGRDAFLLTAGVNLPIYRKRLDSAVRSAEAKAVATAREYDSLRDATLEEVTDLFALAQSHEHLLVSFEQDILPKARQTFEVSSLAYNAGEVDFLQLIDNWRQLLRYQISYRRLEATHQQTLAELERVVGGFGFAAPLPMRGSVD